RSLITFVMAAVFVRHKGVSLRPFGLAGALGNARIGRPSHALIVRVIRQADQHRLLRGTQPLDGLALAHDDRTHRPSPSFCASTVSPLGVTRTCDARR